MHCGIGSPQEFAQSTNVLASHRIRFANLRISSFLGVLDHLSMVFISSKAKPRIQFKLNLV